jgi:hypothetical protein
MEIDGKPSGGREVVKNLFQVGHMLRDRTNDDKSIVGVLEDRASKIIHQKMKKETRSGGTQEEIPLDKALSQSTIAGLSDGLVSTDSDSYGVS